MTTAVGSPRATSRAKLGPERADRRGAKVARVISAMTSLMRAKESCSRPLVALTKIMRASLDVEMRQRGRVGCASVRRGHDAEHDVGVRQALSPMSPVTSNVVGKAHARKIDGVLAALRSAARTSALCTHSEMRCGWRLRAKRDGQRRAPASRADDGDFLHGLSAQHAELIAGARPMYTCGSVPSSSRTIFARWRTMTRTIASDAPADNGYGGACRGA